MNDHHDLRGLLDRALTLHGQRSGRALADLAQRNGHEISHATINLIRSGAYKSRPSSETVRAIAWLAQVNDEVAFRAAGLRVPGRPFADELPEGVDGLSPEARRAVIALLRVLVQQEEVIGDGQRDAAPTRPSRALTSDGLVLLEEMWVGLVQNCRAELEERGVPSDALEGAAVLAAGVAMPLLRRGIAEADAVHRAVEQTIVEHRLAVDDALGRLLTLNPAASEADGDEDPDAEVEEQQREP
ncbi:MAG: hypothetical protein NVV66_18440 [Cellulomonas sp.]|uniref:hypothetical protein n=1 Tax=Cellulomonas sp. TaxID=40001 RepID=UPI00258EB9E9|nr:hypothetical protein [Cellulomonas sp.]MCR6706577.1 hypothetical protein [Cellulomonas sp.]